VLFPPTRHLTGGYEAAWAAADGDTHHPLNLTVLKPYEPDAVAADPCPLRDRGVPGVAVEQRLVATIFSTGDDNLSGTTQCFSLSNARVVRARALWPGIDPEDRAAGRRRCGFLRTRWPLRLAFAVSRPKGVEGEGRESRGYNDRERGQSIQPSMHGYRPESTSRYPTQRSAQDIRAMAESGPPTRCFAPRLAKRRLRADSVRRPGVRDHHGRGECEQERDSSEDEEGDGNPRHRASGFVAASPACLPRHTASVAAQATSGRVRARASA
jgi:hypothetical protein